MTAIALTGSDKVESVQFTASGVHRQIATDSVLLHQGVIPETHLARSAGCAMIWNESYKAFAPRRDPHGRSSLRDILIAGDAAGIGGARVAELEGQAVALNALADLGLIATDSFEQCRKQVQIALKKYKRGRRFIDALYLPEPQFLIPPNDSTLVCRCEEITAGMLRQVIESGVAGPNQLKTMTRCGMGPCQGRLCEPTITHLLADSSHISPQDIGHLRIRPPVKPIRLAEIAAMPCTPESVFAVTGKWPDEQNPLPERTEPNT